MLEMGCIYRSAEEIADISFLCSEAALIIGILDCKCCFTLLIVREGFISSIQLDVSHCVDAHSKSTVLSVQPLLVAFCDAACQVLVLDLSAKLHPTGGGGGERVHFKGKTTDSSALQGCVPVDRAALSLFGLSTGVGLSTTSDALYVDQDQATAAAAVEYMSREETTRYIVQTCRFDQCGSSELLDLGVPSLMLPRRGQDSRRYSRYPLLSASSEALIVRNMGRSRSGHQSSSDDMGSVEMVRVRFSPSAATVDLLRLYCSRSSRATTGKVGHLKKYFDELSRVSRSAAAARKQSFQAVSGGELQSSTAGIEAAIFSTDLERGSFTRRFRRGDKGLGFDGSGSFIAPNPKKTAVSFAARQLGSSSSSISLVKVVVAEQEQDTAFVVPILSDPTDHLTSDWSSKDSSSSSRSEITQYPAVYRLSRAHSGCILHSKNQKGGLQFLDFDDLEACLAFIESCIVWRGSSFMHIISEEALETVASMLLSSSKGEQQLQLHDDAAGVACKEFFIGTLACEEGMICLYYLPLLAAVEQHETTNISLEPICLLNIRQRLPSDLYCAGVDWRIARVVFTRRHIIVCTARAPALNTCRVVVLRLADFTVESVFALPTEEETVLHMMASCALRIGPHHVEEGHCRTDTLVLLQTRLLIYCIRESPHQVQSVSGAAWDKHKVLPLHHFTLSIPSSLHRRSSLLERVCRLSFNPTPKDLLDLMGGGLDLISSNDYLQTASAEESSGAGMSRPEAPLEDSYRCKHHSPSSSIQTSLQIRVCGDFGGCLEMLFWFLDTPVSSSSSSSVASDWPLLDRLELIMMCIARIHLLISERMGESLRICRSRERGRDTGRHHHSGLVHGLVLMLSLLQPYRCDSDTQQSSLTLDVDSGSLRRIIRLSMELYAIVSGDLESVRFNSALQSTTREFSVEVGRCFIRCASQLGIAAAVNIAGKQSFSPQLLHLTILLQHFAAGGMKGSSTMKGSSSSQQHLLYHLYPRYLQLSIYRAELRSHFLEDHHSSSQAVDLELLLCREVFQYLMLFMQNAVGSGSMSDPTAMTIAQSAIAEVLVLWQRRSIACQHLEQEVLQWISSPPESDPLVALLLDAFLQLFFFKPELLLPCSDGAGVSAKAALRSMQFSSSFLMKILRHKATRSPR